MKSDEIDVLLDSKDGTRGNVPLVYVNSLIDFIKERLDDYQQYGLLAWTPEMKRNEIWIKIGGDHGGGNFKMTLQIINYSSVNSGVNTPVVLMFNAKDDYENIKRLGMKMISSHLHRQHMNGRVRRLSYFLQGTWLSFFRCMGFLALQLLTHVFSAMCTKMI